MSPLRGIVSVILDDEELEWGGPGSEDRSGEMTVVVVRRKGLGIYRLSSRMTAVKEIPLPSPPTHHALFSGYLCAAIPSTNTYSIIDFSDASLTEVLPVSQIDAAVLDFEPNPNVVVIPGENEFLVTSYTGASTMGVFLNAQGDPVRGTMEWETHPLSIAIESGFVIALLRNHTIVIHSLSDLDKSVHTVSLEPTFGAFALSYSPYGISVRDVVRDQRMGVSRMLLLRAKTGNPDRSDREEPTLPDDLQPIQQDADSRPEVASPTEEPPSGSGLTPPSSPPPFKRQPITPTRGSSLLQATSPSARGPFSTTVAETFVVGLNGVQSLAPTPLVLKLEMLCAERRMEEAMYLVDEERRKGRRGEIDGDKATHHATLRLLHLFLASHLFLEAIFEKAGEYFLRGKADPRLLVRLYPTFRGKVIGSAEEVEVYEGLRGVLADMPSLDEIVLASIKRIYGMNESPDEQAVSETAELRAKLNEDAKEMLADFLRKTRASRRKGGGARGVDSRKIDIVIDTTLSKLLADAGITNELLALLAGPNDVALSELEPFLVHRPYVLSTVLRRQGRVDRVLELLREIAENPEPDPLCEDPVDEIAQLLESVKDPELFRKYGLWLVARDANKALTILTAQNVKTGVKLDDAALVEDIRAIDSNAANRYLEHVVVMKRSPNRSLHQALLSRLLDLAVIEVGDDGVKYHLEELDAEYRLLVDPQPFCVFLADVAPDTPIKSLRLKLMLFLQGSPFYDLTSAAARLEAIPTLKPEWAIVLGRLARNREALHLLARDIGDALSAQTYCTQGGEIIPPRVARAVARLVPELEGWATLGETGRRRRGTVDAQTQEGLVMELLGVYMRDGATTAKHTAALLNAQSVHLDVLEVLALVPPEWPMDVVSSFFQRSLRRQLHDRASWQILKSISAGQNLEVSERYLDRITQIPPAIVNGPSSPSDARNPDDKSIAEKERESFDEKRAMLAMGGDEEEKGFFAPGGVEKELADLHSEEEREERYIEGRG